MSVNKVILVGNAGKNPDVRRFDSGSVVARFSVATNETFKGKDGNNTTHTEWHNVVVWGKLAEVAEKYIKSGTLLYVEGRIKTEKYDDKEGNTKTTTNIACDTFRLLGGKHDSKEQSNTSTQQPTQQNDVVQDPNDDLPF